MDLVLIAATHDINGDQLRIALAAEALMRRLDLPSAFMVPAAWGRVYAAKAKTIPAIRAYDAAAARALMAEFLDPVLDGSCVSKMWIADEGAWLLMP